MPLLSSAVPRLKDRAGIHLTLLAAASAESEGRQGYIARRGIVWSLYDMMVVGAVVAGIVAYLLMRRYQDQ